MTLRPMLRHFKRRFSVASYGSKVSLKGISVGETKIRAFFCSACLRIRPAFLGSRRLYHGNDSKREGPEEREATKEEIGRWLSQLRAPPNIITSLRILATPYVSYLIVAGEYELALYGCVVAGISDILDGYLARTYNMETALGTYLDPLADKIFVNALAVALGAIGVLPLPLTALWLGRDLSLVVATYLHVRSRTKKGERVIDPVSVPLKIEPTHISRINTLLQFATISVALFDTLDYEVADALHSLW